MAPQIMSRTQRRIEKKQALILLVLVLAVSLVSFSLGVMVGRGSAPDPVEADSTERVPVPSKSSDSSAVDSPETTGSSEKLTFYDTLPSGNAPPLGSGINLPPAEKVEPKASEPKSAPPPEKTVAKETAQPQPVKPEKPAPPAIVSGGEFLVQAASFRGGDDAEKLRRRLTEKGYAAFTQKVDLGEKGTWERVYVGPFDASASAEKTVAKLKSEEKLSGFVKKR